MRIKPVIFTRSAQGPAANNRWIKEGTEEEPMQVHDKGKGPAPQMSEMSQAYMASLEIELTDLVLGMEAEVAKKATVSVASAQKLRRLRLEAERLFGAFPDEEV